jgi:hypothetical protein
VCRKNVFVVGIKSRLWSKLSWPVTPIIWVQIPLLQLCPLSKRKTSFNKGGVFYKTNRPDPPVAAAGPKLRIWQLTLHKHTTERGPFQLVAPQREKKCCNLSMLMLAVVHTELGSAGGARREQSGPPQWVSVAKLICHRRPTRERTSCSV